MGTMRWFWVLVAAALPLAACEGAEEPATEDFGERVAPEEVAERGRTQYPAPDETYSVPGATGQGSPTAQRITVTNPLQVPLIVTATYNGETRRLGTVEARVNSGFYIQAEPGTRVRLVAVTPEGVERSRRIEETIILSDEPGMRWVISTE